jgi:hypothetical protein
MKATDVTHYEMPVKASEYRSIKAHRQALDELSPAVRLYASPGVIDQFHELATSLTVLYICDE